MKKEIKFVIAAAMAVVILTGGAVYAAGGGIKKIYSGCNEWHQFGGGWSNHL